MIVICKFSNLLYFIIKDGAKLKQWQSNSMHPWKICQKRNPKRFIVSMTTKFWNFPEDTPTLFLHFDFLPVYRIFEEDLIWKRKCRKPKEEVIFRHLRSGGGVGIAEQKLGFTSTTTHRKFHKGIDKWPISDTLYFIDVVLDPAQNWEHIVKNEQFF